MNFENMSDNTAFDFSTIVRGVGLLCYTCKARPGNPPNRACFSNDRDYCIVVSTLGSPGLRFRIKG